MKKIFFVLLFLTFLAGCSSTETKSDTNKDLSLPNHTLYYIENDYQNSHNYIKEVEVNSRETKTILDTTETISMLNYDNGKVYAIFTNKVGYVSNNKINYLTEDDEYVARFTIKDSKLYYGKDNNNMSDDIFERLAVKDNGDKIINNYGISQLIVDDYIYFKPNSGEDVTKLLRYNLDGSNKTILYNGLINQLIKKDDFLYFVDYKDNSIYKIKEDGTNLSKIVTGPVTFINAYVNQISGIYNMGVIDDYLYYINSLDSGKLYKTDGINNTKVVDDMVTSIFIKDDYIYINYNNYNKQGIYVLNKDGIELSKLIDYDYGEYIIR